MAKTFDTTLNSLIDAHAAEWAAYLASRVGLPVGPTEVLDTDLSAALQADRLFRVGGPAPFALHVELQSTGRPGIPRKLLRYNATAHAVAELPVHTVLVLLRPRANAADMTGRYEVRGADGRVYLTFDYGVVRVWRESVEALLSASPGLAPLAILTDEAVRDPGPAFERFRERLRRPDVPVNVANDLFGWTFALGGLRHEKAVLVDQFRRLSMILEDSTTYQWLLAEGEAKGKAEMALKLGALHFGPPSPAAVAAVRAIADQGRLERIALRSHLAAGWDDLLATP